MANATATQDRSTRAATRASGDYVMPPANISATENEYVIELEMPGVPKDGVEVTTEGNELTITGRRSLPTIEGTLLHQESRRENFRRAFEIDPSIDVSKINARIDQGLLTLTLPKAEHVKPRRITVS